MQGAQICWAAPVSKNTRRIWRLLKKALRDTWTDKQEYDRRIELPGGGSITVVTTSDPDNIRSEGYDGMVCDEAAHMEKSVWPLVLRPMLIDRAGWGLWITTPNGFNWFHDEIFEPALSKPGWSCWQRPTYDNKMIPVEELDELEHEYRARPREYAQEILAQFVAEEGAEFPPEYFQDLYHTGPWPKSGVGTVAIDPSLGRAGGDYSAIVSTIYEDGLIFVDADLERRATPELVEDGIDFARNTPGLAAFGIEANAYQELLAPEFDRRCQARGKLPLPIHLLTNKVKKEIRLRRIAPYLQTGKLRFRPGSPGCELLEQQLRAFPLRTAHDDGPDALEMSLRLLDWVVTGHEPEDREERILAE